MFSGIVQALVPVRSLSRAHGDMELEIERPEALEVTNGDSIAVNGVCLTVKRHNHGIVFDVVPETLARSNLSTLSQGDEVNLEPSLRLGDRVGGHLVYGHVDAVAPILAKDTEGAGFRLVVAMPPSLRIYMVEKGFIALDGISLTIAAVSADRFAVALIPETLKRTTLGRKGVAGSVNIEVDSVARYVAALMRGQPSTAPPHDAPRGS